MVVFVKCASQVIKGIEVQDILLIYYIQRVHVLIVFCISVCIISVLRVLKRGNVNQWDVNIIISF